MALLELLAAYLGQSAGVRRVVALHAATVDVLFELLLEDACRGLALGMVRYISSSPSYSLDIWK